jgi:hypothetical protein
MFPPGDLAARQSSSKRNVSLAICTPQLDKAFNGEVAASELEREVTEPSRASSSDASSLDTRASERRVSSSSTDTHRSCGLVLAELLSSMRVLCGTTACCGYHKVLRTATQPSCVLASGFAECCHCGAGATGSKRKHNRGAGRLPVHELEGRARLCVSSQHLVVRTRRPADQVPQ